MKNAAEIEMEASWDTDTKELAALANMMTYAKQTASDLGASLPAYYLDMAIGALREQARMGEGTQLSNTH
ncbi:hypothetical protein DFR52_101246 [Hoeflea marina]|uniref:Uncharacterized protein n=1 Tax=Hoeflea marina TaxID=274592 RepID=A0A317PS53_9HYPH|nr:hypothetical protein [Hoeflea marina]PWW03565.1 hypothetical protein DFR52_101246 [Hoeflea marina]